ncbi:hypothetical protein KO518_00665 [Aestuariibacter sp. A3R04]|nr:hypothetical protein [Aestuariibacter sp. A3R04]
MSEKSNKFTLIGLLLVFVLPVMAAKLALDNRWFNSGATNKGELLQPVRDFSTVLAKQEPKWRIVYSVPETCDAACKNAIYSIHQVWIALGRETDRAEATVILTDTSDQTVLKSLENEHNLHVLRVSDDTASNAMLPQDSGSIMLVDTLNNAMLRYPTFEDKNAAVQSSRDILADVKKLLKLSRIG